MKQNIYYKVLISQCLLCTVTCFGSVEQLAVGLQKIALTVSDKDLPMGFSDEGRPLPSNKNVPNKKDEIIRRWKQQASMLWNPGAGNILEVTLDDDRIGSLSTLINELDAYVKEKKSSSIPSSDAKLFNDYIQALKTRLNVIALMGATVREQKATLEPKELLQWLAKMDDTLKKQDEDLKSLVMKLQQTNSKDYPSTKEIKKLLVDLAGPLESLHQQVHSEVASLQLQTRWKKQVSMLWNPDAGNILEVEFKSTDRDSVHQSIDELKDYINATKSRSIKTSYTELFDKYISALHSDFDTLFGVVAAIKVFQESGQLRSEQGLEVLKNADNKLKLQDNQLKELVTQLQQTKWSDYQSTKDIKDLLMGVAKPVQALYKQILEEIANLRVKTRFELDTKRA